MSFGNHGMLSFLLALALPSLEGNVEACVLGTWLNWKIRLHLLRLWRVYNTARQTRPAFSRSTTQNIIVLYASCMPLHVICMSYILLITPDPVPPTQCKPRAGRSRRVTACPFLPPLFAALQLSFLSRALGLPLHGGWVGLLCPTSVRSPGCLS